MGALSKLADVVPTVACECRAVTHVWEPDCFMAVAKAAPMSFLFAVKTYGTLYCVVGLLKMRQTGRLKWKSIATSTVRSATFITLNMAAYLYFTCKLRQLFGFYFFGTFYIAGFFGSLIAIILEQKKRQSMLTLYFANLASESLYMQLKHRGYVHGIKNGEAILFSIGLAALMYFKSKGITSDIHSIIQYMHSLDYTKDEVIPTKKLPNQVRTLLERLRSNYSSHPKCEHKHSCLSSVLERTTSNFALGLVIGSVLTAFQSIKTPSKLLAKLFSRNNLKLPIFAALMPLIYHTSNCLMNRYCSMEKSTQAIATGALSGLAMVSYSSSTIAMYILWKAIEQCYNRLHEKGIIPTIKYGNILLYSLSTGFIIGNVIIEPQAVRPGYYNFIRGLTVKKVDLFNRLLLDPLGFQSSRSFFWDYVHFLNKPFAQI